MRRLKTHFYRFEARVQNAINRLMPGGARAFGGQALAQEAIAEIEAHIQYAASDVPVFPYNLVTIQFQADTAQEADLFNSDAFQNSLSSTILDKLRGCQTGGSLSIHIGAAAPGEAFPHGSKVKVRCTSLNRPLIIASLEVIAGRATPMSLDLAKGPVRIGRRDESFLAAERETDITFDSAETTVGRRHAEVLQDSVSGSYLVKDAKTQYGTVLLRRGKRLAVSPKGIVLEPGDEILLGAARIRYHERAPAFGSRTVTTGTPT